MCLISYFSGIAQFSTYPFGYTAEDQLSNGTLKLKCMHRDDCKLNTEIACIMDKVEFKVERYLPVINCIFKAQNPSENVARCLNGTLPEVNYNYVKNCSTVNFSVHDNNNYKGIFPIQSMLLRDIWDLLDQSGSV